MRKCNKCKIDYNGNLNYCPLCQNTLKGTKSESVFPKLKEARKPLLYKLLLFISFAIGVLFSFFEYMITSNLKISKCVWLGLITNYILLKFIFKNYKDILKMMNKYFWVILFILIIWFLIIRSLFITTYLIPILCLIMFIFNSITMIVLKDNYLIKFGKTIVLDCIIGFIPLLLVYLNLSTFKLLSYCCAVIDFLMLTGLIIFCKDNIIEELKKIFNF